MNNQSDYGYTIGQLERRDHALCIGKLALCRKFARDYAARGFPETAATFRDYARGWIAEARAYGHAEGRRYRGLIPGLGYRPHKARPIREARRPS